MSLSKTLPVGKSATPLTWECVVVPDRRDQNRPRRRCCLTACPHCFAAHDRPSAARPPSDGDFVICLNCGKRSPWCPLGGGPVRVRVVWVNMNRAELVLFGGGKRLDLLGVKVGARWDLSAAGVHVESMRRILPRLEGTT